MDFIAAEHEVAVPPAFKIEVALCFRVYVGPEMILLVPVSLRRVEIFEAGNQVSPIEGAVAQVAPPCRLPHPAGQPPFVAQGVFAIDPRPVRQGRPVHYQGCGDIRPLGAQQGRRPAGLAVADDGRVSGLRVAVPNQVHKSCHGRLNMVQGLTGLRPGREENDIYRISLVQGHTDFGIPLGTADTRAVTRTGINDNDRAFGHSVAGIASHGLPLVPGFRKPEFGGVAAVPYGCQVKVGRRGDFSAVQQDVVVETEHWRLAPTKVVQELISPSPQNIAE